MLNRFSNKEVLWHPLRLMTIVVILLFCFVSVSAQTNDPRRSKISLDYENTALSAVLLRVEELSGYKISFTYDEIQNYQISIHVKNKNVDEVMNKLVENTSLLYSIKGKFITVYKSQKAKEPVTRQNNRIVGVITDTEGEPVIGANIYVDGDQRYATTSDVDGVFTIWVPENEKKLIITYVGMEQSQLALNGTSKSYKVVMKPNAKALGEVVVTGMFTRRAESFTGSAVTYKRDEIKAVGNQNILKSLSNLDPSFQIMDNLANGSDPNNSPTIQMRGASSFNLHGDYEGNPNQPLFILDGFETDITKMYDLDMNRIESVTILKDASAKAIYGSKAGNGVIVIETSRPKSGELKVHYSGDLNIEAPDLTGYNMMNAQEKLELENSLGMYSDYATGAANLQMLQNRYKEYYDNIQRGVDTYWLSQPLRTGVGQKHTLSFEGGDSRMRYQAGVMYNNIQGVMKGSDRNTFNINTTLSYSYKNLIFRNTLEYSKNWSNNTPYGSFSDYVSLNPYWTPYDENGNVKKTLGYIGLGSTPVYNPLYNASLNTKSTSNYMEIRDNFGLEWNISKALRATARVSYVQRKSGADTFYPSSHTMFAEYDLNGLSARKGRYTKSEGTQQSISADAGINFNKTIGKHLFFANATWNMAVNKITSNSYTAEGFGNDYMDNISFATQYQYNGKPTGSDSESREIGLIGAINYSYDDRFLFDASYRATGSSIYGSDNRWGGFWSLGIGWNVHKEKFMKNLSAIQQLKLRASTGYTGTQNFNPYQARATYKYGNIVYDGLLGAELQGLPNSSLRWQKVKDTNIGFDLGIAKIISARFDYYTQNTSNLLSDITTAPSTGFTTYKENLGEISNKGYEIMLAVTPWRNNQERGWATLTVSALHNNNKIKKIYDIFKSYNEEQNKLQNNTVSTNNNQQASDEEYIADGINKTHPRTLYYEGCSMTAIWGVRSVGIDPMTGKELYLDKNGNPTYTWSTEDQVVIGDTSPKLSGSFNISAGWKGWNLSLVCSYKLGGDLYNTTLIDKVENITGYSNLDKRVNDCWSKPGDIALYRKLEIQNITSMNWTRPTSRFVQRNNELYISSMFLGYEFIEMGVLKKLRLERLKLTFGVNDLLRLSSVKIERGTSYPYARTFSFSVQATF